MRVTKNKRTGTISMWANGKKDSGKLLAFVEAMIGRQSKEWFKNRVGVHVKYVLRKGKNGEVLIRDTEHALYLYNNIQGRHGAGFRDCEQKEVANG